MKHPKHFSFDLWFTLIKSNPQFKKERALYFFRHFNAQRKSLAEVESVFRSVDLMCNAINERTGKNISSEEMYLMVVYQLNGTLTPFAATDFNGLYEEMERLFFNYAPSLFSAQTPEVLSRLKQLPGTTMNILSNTAFIKGAALKKVISGLGLSEYFDFQIYSDEAGASKPSSEIFRVLLNQVYRLRSEDGIALNEIMHVGDNPVADIEGARAAGIHAFQINTNDNLISNLLG